MSKSDSIAASILRMPLVWGGLASLAFFTLLEWKFVPSAALLTRYCAGHPIEYLEVIFFFVGAAALLDKAIDVALQQARVTRISLGAAPAGGQRIEDAAQIRGRFLATHAGDRDSYLFRRLSDSLEYIERKGSADTLDEHLRFASDLDVGRMQASYSLVRIIIWAIPILGFLGTVVGITMAIARLGPQELESSMPQVISGLEVAFDTTALALVLSIGLMFGQFLVDRRENQLLSDVDDRASSELVGRFQQLGTANDPQVASIRRLAETMVETVGKSVERQAEVWRSTIDAASQGWTQLTRSTGEELEKALAVSLSKTLKAHAASLKEMESAGREAVDARWRQAVASLDASAKACASQQAELVRQGEVLTRVVEATSQIQALETALNGNLSALAGSRNFEETVLSLAAAVQLLAGQLHATPAAQPRVELSLHPGAREAA